MNLSSVLKIGALTGALVIFGIIAVKDPKAAADMITQSVDSFFNHKLG